eukprot:924280-Amphidinium_carterae.2
MHLHGAGPPCIAAESQIRACVASVRMKTLVRQPSACEACADGASQAVVKMRPKMVLNRFVVVLVMKRHATPEQH